MSRCERELRRGKHQLAHHDPESALRAFESALNLCPVEDPRHLSLIFYYLAFTLLRLGRRNGALRSFTAAARLRKRSCYSVKMLHRLGNEYGMVRQPSPELDDWRAFYSIHLQRYLRSKKTQRITTSAEGDMIRDLIFDYWKSLKSRQALKDRSAEEKLALFRSVEIVFPFYMVPNASAPNIIAVDFLAKSRIAAQDRCRCGSGMPFMMCCGRTRGVDELVPGTF